jgi:integrase
MTGTKISLTKADKEKLLNYKSEINARQVAVDFWVLSYLCYGRNMTDIAMLKYSNIQNDTIVAVRQKTIDAKQNKDPLVIPISDRVKAIISKYGKKTLDPNSYVFNILHPGMTALQQKYKIRDFIKEVNDNLEDVAGELGIKVNLTTYTARHTFATMLRDSGVPTNFIQKLMDHESSRTTEIYFGGHTIEEKIKVANFL